MRGKGRTTSSFRDDPAAEVSRPARERTSSAAKRARQRALPADARGEGAAHRTVLVEHALRRAYIDEALAPLVLETWKAGVEGTDDCRRRSASCRAPMRSIM